MPVSRPTALGALLIATAAAVASCSSGSTQSGSDSSTPSPSVSASSGSASAESPGTGASASASSTPTPTPTPEPVWHSPLTGLPGGEPEPVLVVKLDNTRNAQPHAGLVNADVVYIEEVEYGITRLAAVFSSSVPDRIGPVRSARITDIDLLAQFRKPAFAYSGAQRKMYPVIDKAPLQDVSPRRGGEGYARDSSRRAPYNYFLDGEVALQRAPKASLSRDIGFVFDEAVPPGGRTATDAQMKWGYASAGFEYRPKKGTYAVSLNGVKAEAEENKAGQQAATVVIQYVDQNPSPFYDKGGGNTPHAETIGSGRAVVLRDGLGWKVQWSRPSAKEGTTFTMADGSPMAFKPGQVWVALLSKERKATLTPWTWPPGTEPSDSATPSTTPSTSPSSTTSPTSSTSTTPTGSPSGSTAG